MDHFEKRLEEIEKNRSDRLSGKLTCIPFYKAFPRLSKHVPGLIKGVQYKILSYTGIGKTKLGKFLSIFLPLQVQKDYPDANITFKTFYFLLEETIDEAIDSLIVALLALNHNVYIDELTLKSMYEDVLHIDILNLIKSDPFKEKVKAILKCVEFIDNTLNGFGIYKKVRSYMETVGTVHIKEVKIEGSDKTITVKSHYTYDDPYHYVFVVTDHVSLLKKEGKKNKHETIAHFSYEYCRKQMTGFYKNIVINIQQMEMKGDDIAHFKAGRLEPTMDKAATNKEILRDDLVVIGLFAPDRYGLENYIGYPIVNKKDEYRSLRDNFRSVHILKNRIGTPNAVIPLFFNGAAGSFKELPKQGDKKYKPIMEKVFKLINNIKSKNGI